MRERGHWEPISMPPVGCPENPDGTFSWPTGLDDGYTVIRDFRDVPEDYLKPPRRWVRHRATSAQQESGGSNDT